MLSLSQLAWSQQKPTLYAGLQQQLSLHRLSFRLSLMPTASLEVRRHTLAAAPVLLIREFPDATHELVRLSGLQLSYQYMLSAREQKKLRFYAEAVGKSQFFKDSWTSNYWDEAKQAYVDSPQEARELLLEAYAGLGLRYQLSPRLFLQSSSMAGYGISRLTRSGSSPVNSDNSIDYRAYKDGGLVFAINLGLHLRLNK